MDVFVKVMSLLLNMPSRFVIAFLPRGRWLLISWLQSPSAGILEPKKIKSITVSIISSFIFHEVMGPGHMKCVHLHISCKDGQIKDRNVMYLTEAEDIKKRWQEYTEELYKKDLHDPDNHSGVITHLEPDILEREVKWALGSITMNKPSGGDGIPVELFQILKDDAVKVLHSMCQQIWKLSRGHRTGKGWFSFQSQIKAMPKSVQTTTQLHTFHMLAK